MSSTEPGKPREEVYGPSPGSLEVDQLMDWWLSGAWVTFLGQIAWVITFWVVYLAVFDLVTRLADENWSSDHKVVSFVAVLFLVGALLFPMSIVDDLRDISYLVAEGDRYEMASLLVYTTYLLTIVGAKIWHLGEGACNLLAWLYKILYLLSSCLVSVCVLYFRQERTGRPMSWDHQVASFGGLLVAFLLVALYEGWEIPEEYNSLDTLQLALTPIVAPAPPQPVSGDVRL